MPSTSAGEAWRREGREAMVTCMSHPDDDMIAIPPRALVRHPPFFSNLARATLPTASLSPPHPVASVPIHSPRSSIDSLRHVHAGIPLQQPGLFSSWFSQSDPPESPENALPPSQAYLAPAHPVVFCHGLLGFDSVTIGPAIAPLEVSHWRGIASVLQHHGVQVLITRVPATSSPVDRAHVLLHKIEQTFPNQSVHLIGHSMGGLDCRYLTSHLTDRSFSVLSLTTIATPHRGSSFADHFLSTLGKDRLPQLLSLLDLLPNGGGDGKAFEFLTLDNMRKFNHETPNVPGVRYFSWGATYDPGLIDTWKYSHSVILDKEGPNDGLVSIQSAKWGTYLGTLNHVNHLDLVGWINTARYKWAEIMGNEIKFRPATFYLGIVDMLAREVEGLDDSHPPSSGHERHQMLDSLQAASREHDGDVDDMLDPPSIAKPPPTKS
jgi:triacylglycerol lipase